MRVLALSLGRGRSRRVLCLVSGLARLGTSMDCWRRCEGVVLFIWYARRSFRWEPPGAYRERIVLLALEVSMHHRPLVIVILI